MEQVTNFNKSVTGCQIHRYNTMPFKEGHWSFTLPAFCLRSAFNFEIQCIKKLKIILCMEIFTVQYCSLMSLDLESTYTPFTLSQEMQHATLSFHKVVMKFIAEVETMIYTTCEHEPASVLHVH